MDAIEALTKFIKHLIIRPRADRYISLIKSSKNQIKFIRMLDHDFQNYISPDKIVQRFDPSIWSSPAYSFENEFGFGRRWNSFKEAYEKLYTESIVIITQDGGAGLFIPEFPTDEIFLAI